MLFYICNTSHIAGRRLISSLPAHIQNNSTSFDVNTWQWQFDSAVRSFIYQPSPTDGWSLLKYCLALRAAGPSQSILCPWAQALHMCNAVHMLYTSDGTSVPTQSRSASFSARAASEYISLSCSTHTRLTGPACCSRYNHHQSKS